MLTLPRLLATLALLTALVPRAGRAQTPVERPRALVWTFGDVQAPALLTELGKTLAARLSAAERYAVVEPTDVLAGPLAALAPACAAVPTACAAEAARLAEAEVVLVARLAREGGALRLRLWWVAAAGELLAEYQGAYRRELARTDAQLAVDRLLARLPAEPEATPAVVEVSAAPPVATEGDGLAPSEPAGAPDLAPEEEWLADDTPWRVDEPEAELLHAHAAIAEARGELEPARQLLRQALALAPDDPLIAFDLARLALEQPAGAAPTDADAFLAAPGDDQASQLLLAHLLARRGERDRAAAITASLAAAAPEDRELGLLQARLAPAPAPVAKAWRASVRLSAQADSNVSVLPEDDPSQLTGLRSGADGAVAWTPQAGAWRGELGARFSTAVHLNDRDALALYDLGAGALVARGRWELAPFSLEGELVGSAVLIDTFGEQFLREAGGRLQVGLMLGGWELGLFGRAAYRDFVYGNAEADLEDRDGPSVHGGLTAHGRLGALRLRLAAAALAELADGAHQDVQGALASADGLLRVGALRLEAGLTWTLRNYPHSRRRLGPDADERTDQRLTPHLRLAWTLTDGYALFGSYALTRNLSLARFDYTRHLGQLGVEATW